MQKEKKKKRLGVGHLLCGREAGRMLGLEGNFEIMGSNTIILQIKQDLRRVKSFALGHPVDRGRSGT